MGGGEVQGWTPTNEAIRAYDGLGRCVQLTQKEGRCDPIDRSARCQAQAQAQAQGNFGTQCCSQVTAACMWYVVQHEGKGNTRTVPTQLYAGYCARTAGPYVTQLQRLGT